MTFAVVSAKEDHLSNGAPSGFKIKDFHCTHLSSLTVGCPLGGVIGPPGMLDDDVPESVESEI